MGQFRFGQVPHRQGFGHKRMPWAREAQPLTGSPAPTLGADETSLLQVLNTPAKGGRIDPGAGCEIDERCSLARSDSHKEGELLGGQPERLEARVVVTRDCTRGRASLEPRALGRHAPHGIQIKRAHIHTLDMCALT
ncbi:MAG: hypothetical protein NVSMB26_13310 [Beijerinckiaceae bacterium]